MTTNAEIEHMMGLLPGTIVRQRLSAIEKKIDALAAELAPGALSARAAEARSLERMCNLPSGTISTSLSASAALAGAHQLL